MNKAGAILLSGLLISLSWLTGCGSSGPELAPVTGVVTRGGSPVVKGSVTFTPTSEGARSYGVTDEKGEFTLKYMPTDEPGAVLGPHRFAIEGGQTIKGKDGKDGAPPPIAAPGKGDTAAQTYEVKPGKNHFPIEL